jgi:hypothetical protein
MNSRFLLNTEHERQYFETYCLPGASTATMGGVDPNRRSRIGRLTRQTFMQRQIACMVRSACIASAAWRRTTKALDVWSADAA